MALAAEVVESGLVLPAEETPRGSLWLSNLDIPLASRHHTPLIYVYRPNGDPDFFNVGTLKAALSKALVPFYPVAGRLVKGRDGRFEINCTGEGVMFVVARCESSVGEFGEFVPSAEMRELFVPAVPATLPTILFMVQVTLLKDGTVILGTAFHHGASDGYGAMNLIKTWTDMARGVPELAALHPFHDRTLLRARSPPTVLFDHIGNKSITDTSTLIKSPPTTVILKLSRSQINLLKKSSTKPALSVFQLVTAHLWRCTCIARGLTPDQETRIYFPVGARNRLRPPLPSGFFGNVLCRKTATVKVKDLIMWNGLEFGAERIREETARVNDEYMRSLIDMLEVSMHNGVMALPRTDFAVVSWLGMPVYDADFGWGEPEFVRRASLFHCGYAYIMDSPRSDGEICALVSVETENMERFNKAFYEDFN